MSGRSPGSSKVIVTASGSVRGVSNGVKFAGDDAKDKMYEPKQTKKLVRVLTVVAYLFSVSLAAILLSVYYVFLWNPPRTVHPRQIAVLPACPQQPAVSGGVMVAQVQVQDSIHNIVQPSAYVTATTSHQPPTYSPLIELLTQISTAPQISTTTTQTFHHTSTQH